VFLSRSPERMAELIGEFADRGAGGDGVQQFYTGLGEVTEDDVRRVLESLGAADPAKVYVPPQRIPEAQRR